MVPYDLIKLAEKVRAAFEEIGSCNCDLAGWCGTASSHLAEAAKRLGIHGVDICVGSGHVYCMYSDNIIDITATQFGVQDKVFIVSLFDLKEELAKRQLDNWFYWKQTSRNIAPYPLKSEHLQVVQRHTGELAEQKEATV